MLTHIPNIWKRLVALLPVSVLALMAAPASVLAANIPNVTPNTHFKGSNIATSALDVICGVVLLGCVAIALFSVFGIVSAVRSHHGNVGKNVAGFFAAVVAIIVVSQFTPFMNGLTHSFGG